MYDVIVIGSGPAGLMASIAASKNNKVLLLEKNEISGKKLLITGGGRCNLTNLKSNRDFLDEVDYNKKYLYSAINKFGPQDIYDYFTSHGVKLKEEEDNKIFPVSNRANEILQCLLDDLKKVDIRYHENVIDIKLIDELKEVTTNKGIYTSKNIIIATGGSSFKQTGSTGDNMRFAKMLNQPTVNLFPAEVGLVLKDNLQELAGTSFEEVTVKYMNKKTTGNLIFTHRGISGSAIMKISEHVYLNDSKEITIDLLPSITSDELRSMINDFDREKELATFLTTLFTKRFSNYLVDKLHMNVKIKSLYHKTIDKVINEIKEYKLSILKVEDLDKAYVTGGGIDMNSIDTSTMESKINKGVYFVGEALDIHGPIGGYNITLALSTGFLAGSSIRK